jgi:DNA-directed RNA polymerase specialized sigma24 family protein
MTQLVQLYRENVADVYGYLAYRLGSREQAEALTQATFERAAGEENLLADAEGARLQLLRMARDTAARHGHVEPGGHPGLSEDLAWALDRLEREERSVVSLRFGAGLPGPHIAAVLGIAEDRVARRLSRALRRLRTELGEDERPEDGAPAS